MPQETARSSAPRAYGAPVPKGQLPPGFVFPADGSLNDVVRALNQLRAYDEGRTLPAPERAEPAAAPRATRARPAQPVPARPSAPPAELIAPATERAVEGGATASNYVYRSYRTRSGARVVELVERPEGGIELLSNIPQRPPQVKPVYPDPPASASSVAPLPRAFAAP